MFVGRIYENMWTNKDILDLLGQNKDGISPYMHTHVYL